MAGIVFYIVSTIDKELRTVVAQRYTRYPIVNATVVSSTPIRGNEIFSFSRSGVEAKRK